MPRFSVSLSMLFGEQPFLQRFAACREAGFDHIEYMFPYDYPVQTLKGLLEKNDLKQVLFNLPAGDWDKGDRGVAANPARMGEFRRGVEQALEYSGVLGVERINCLVGKGSDEIPHEEQWNAMVQNLRYAASMLAREERTLLIEPINTHDIPGFCLSTTDEAVRLLNEVGADNLMIQYDVYHMSKMEENLTETIRVNLQSIGHIQIADNPGRHQPGTGEINYQFLLGDLDRMGYDGFVGLEYLPTPDTVSSLIWVEELGFTLQQGRGKTWNV